MRQLFVSVPRGTGDRVLATARRCGARNLALVQGRDDQRGDLDLVLIHLDNSQVGPFLEAVDRLQDVHISFHPSGVLTLWPPADRVPSQVEDVTPRSPFEIFLAGLQSIGSWQGFLGYAAIAGVVVWIGLFTSTTYLLVASMLISPFAAPAMNAAVATARGDRRLLLHSVLRYVAGLGVGVAVAGLLSLIFRQQTTTSAMASTSAISDTAVLLPLAAGAAGALHLSQSSRSSLVSGAAVGMLIAASTTPAAGLVGMSAALGEWSLAWSGLFLLALQLVGINFSAAVVFRLVGLAPQGPRYRRGTGRLANLAVAGSLVIIVALVATQLLTPSPYLQRSTIEERTRAIVHDEVGAVGGAQLAAVTATFTRPSIPHQNTLLIQIYVQDGQAGGARSAELQHTLTSRVQQAVRQRYPDVTPLVDVTVLQPPSATSPGGG